MDYGYIVLVSLLSLAALFLLTRLMGNRQVSELTLFDYIIGISFGSIAAEMATELEEPLKPLLAMVVYALTAVTISFATSKSLPFRRGVMGKSVVLMKNGKLLRENFKRAKLDLSAFLMQCRTGGYFDLSALCTVLLEPNGKLSFLPYPDRRPVTAQDMKIVPSADELFYNVIMDGRILPENLKRSGHDENWLKRELQAQGADRVSDIFFAQLSRDGTLKLFYNLSETEKNDPFS